MLTHEFYQEATRLCDRASSRLDDRGVPDCVKKATWRALWTAARAVIVFHWQQCPSHMRAHWEREYHAITTEIRRCT